MDKGLDAVIVALYSDDNVLLVAPAGSDRWGFPGGMLLQGERHGAGARRKALQETGISIDGIPLEALCAYQKAPGHCIHLFGVKLNSGAFNDIGATGPRGHRFLLCPVSMLTHTRLRDAHRECLERIARRRIGRVDGCIQAA